MADSEVVLLERFSTQADAEAFAQLVQRYAGMVYSTSWRVLQDEGEAADVTQETFFELTRQAGRISGSLGNWLHSVATRKSVDTIRRATSRRRREQVYVESRPAGVQTWQDLSGHVDQALDEVEESLKSLLVEHFFAGKTTVQLAQEHGLSQATISRRISDGLEQLRGKLRRQGLLVAGAAIGTMLMENTSMAVPATVTAELTKMALVGATGATACAGGGAVATTKVAMGLKAVVCAAAATAIVGAGSYMYLARPTDAPQGPPASMSGSSGAASGAGNAQPTGGMAVGTHAGFGGMVGVASDGLAMAEQDGIDIQDRTPSEGMGVMGGMGGMVGGMAGVAADRIGIGDLSTPEGTLQRFMQLVDQGSTDQLGAYLTQDSQGVANVPYLPCLGQPMELEDTTQDGNGADVTCKATVVTEFTAAGRTWAPGDVFTLKARLIEADGQWKIAELR